MTLLKYRTNDLFSHLPSFERLFDRFFQNDSFSRDLFSEGLAPAVNIASEKDEYVISVELPGVNPEDIEVNLDRDLLTISGEKKSDREEKEYHRMESCYGRFVRKIQLPSEADNNNISASFKNGILNIRIKISESAKPRLIPIKTK